MNNSEKNGGFYAENSRNSCADISSFRNNFGPKPAICSNLVEWTLEPCKKKRNRDLSAPPLQEP